MNLPLEHRSIVPPAVATTAGFAAVAALASWKAGGGADQTLLTIVAGGFLAVLAALRPRLAILATFLYLAALGDLRRLVMYSAGQVRSDPMLLVAPASAALLAATALLRRRLCIASPLSRLVAALMVLMVVQILNPLQGGLLVGVAGALFHLVPLLWFWIGQAWGSPLLLDRLLHRLVVPLAAAAALLGVWQVINGFLPYQQHWIDEAGYAALSVQGRIRPFAFFTSSAEFAHYAGIAAMVLAASLLRRTARPAAILLPLLLCAVILQGSRSVVVLAILALAVMWAFCGGGRAWIGRMALAVVVAAGGMIFLLTHAQDADLPVDVQPLVEHQVRGLTHPLDAQHSTAELHWQMMVDGLRQGIVHPLGHGLGATTLAARKLGSGGGSSEVDVSDIFVCLGPVGGLLYLLLIGSVLRAAARRSSFARNILGLAVLGILVLELGRWLNGGQYATAALVWFCIGSLDRPNAGEDAP